MKSRARTAAIIASMTVAFAACGGDTDTSGTSAVTGADTPATTAADDTTTTTAPQATATTAATASAASTAGSGRATLTVGDQVYEFDNYYCRVGGANTRNENISFSSGAFGEVDGNRVQLDASIYDPDGNDRMDGDVTRSVSLRDVTDFSNPKVAVLAESGFQPDPVTFEFDGSTLRVETTFDDEVTEEFDGIPGVLEATCGE